MQIAVVPLGFDRLVAANWLHERSFGNPNSHFLLMYFVVDVFVGRFINFDSKKIVGLKPIWKLIYSFAGKAIKTETK